MILDPVIPRTPLERAKQIVVIDAGAVIEEIAGETTGLPGQQEVAA
jgi:hypothetical protein